MAAGAVALALGAAVLHAVWNLLLAGAEDCGPSARTARLAQGDELADFLLRVQGEVAEEAGRLLAERVAE